MSQTYNDNMKRPNLKDILPGILITYAFCWKLQWRVLDPGKSTDRVTYYLSLRIHSKLGGSRKGAVGA